MLAVLPPTYAMVAASETNRFSEGWLRHCTAALIYEIRAHVLDALPESLRQHEVVLGYPRLKNTVRHVT